jgi:hypothetical protein
MVYFDPEFKSMEEQEILLFSRDLALLQIVPNNYGAQPNFYSTGKTLFSRGERWSELQVEHRVLLVPRLRTGRVAISLP